MVKLCLSILALIVVLSGINKLSASDKICLVAEGEARGYLIIADSADELDWKAAEYFVRIVRQSTGAELPLIRESEWVETDEQTPRLYIGNTLVAQQRGLVLGEDTQETYRVVAQGNEVFVLGSPNGEFNRVIGARSRPVLWALDRLLEEQLGVRWLWPGELGTHVPEHSELSIPVQDVTYQPKLIIRSLRVDFSSARPFASSDPLLDKMLEVETTEWLENHLAGRRAEVRFGHAFSEWWGKYAEDHPDLFAVPPPGVQQVLPGRVKLRLANPKVIDFIVQEYIAAGAPDYYNVCPNDGFGFDTSEETRGWDIPADQDINDIWYARGNLTARYVRFWNLLYERLKEINPNVCLATYAYSAYREPPPDELPVAARMFIGIVDTYDNYEGWKGWAERGVDMMLRPNWWHQGGDAPYLPLRKTFEFIRFAYENGMQGLDMDSILGYWATQGMNYYLAARMMTRPDLSLEAIIDEYASAFGPASDNVKDYLAYWEKLTDEYNYPLNATGGIRPPSVKSRYEDLVRAKKFGLSILNGSKYALPYLYDDSVIEPAEQILLEGLSKVDSESVYGQRILFLLSGLDSLRATRDVVALGQKLKSQPDEQLLQEFVEQARKLDAYRETLAFNHAIWPERIRRHEDRYRVLIRPEHLKHHEIRLDGF